MSKLPKRFLALASAIALSLVSVGCSSVSIDPSAVPRPTWIENDPDFSADHGHSVDDTSATKLHQVSLGEFTDELGAYTRSKFDAPDIAMVTNGTMPKDAWEFFVEFVSSEVMDSIALDNPAAWNKWKAEVAPRYILKSKIKKLLAPRDPESYSSDLIFTNYYSHNDSFTYVPTLMRDGGPRVFNKEITDITYYPESLGFTISAFVGEILVMDDKGAADFANICCNQGEPFTFPTHQDGKPQVMKLMASINLTVTKEDGAWKIIDFHNSANLVSASLMDNATDATLGLRNF